MSSCSILFIFFYFFSHRSILVAGFVPGEPICFDLVVDNKSNRDIKPPLASLVQVVRLQATTKSKTTHRKVATLELPNRIQERMCEKFDNMKLVVPPVCSSSFGTSRIIDISYYFDLNFDASGPSISTDLNIPVVIGTVPLLRSDQDHPQSSSHAILTFEASIFDANQFKQELIDKGEIMQSDTDTYKPFYPYYKNF